MKINYEKFGEITLNAFKLFFVTSIIGGIIGYIAKSETTLIISTFVLLISAVIYCLRNLKLCIVFLIFLVCLFTFIMGQYITTNTGVQLYIYNFDLNTRIHTILCIYISLIGLLIGHILCRMINKNNQKSTEQTFYLKNNADKLKKISRILFYITMAIMCICLIERVLYKMEYGYLGYMNNFSSRIPFIITYIGGFASVFIYIFFSTMPNKKELILPVILYGVYLILSLLTGSRSTFVLGIISIILYIIIRDYIVEDKKEKIINWKRILCVVVLIPIFIVSLSVYNTTRNGNQIQGFNFFTEINNFFMNQGSSVAVIALGKEYEDQLEEKRYPYMLYSIVKEFESKWNPSIYGAIPKDNNIEERVYEINAFATKLSYWYLGDKVTEGHGLGTSYIAETYADGGYIGVFIINLLFGCLILYFNKLVYKNWIIFTVVMLVLLQFMYVPRDPTFNWFNSLTAVNLWIGIATVYMITLNKNQKIKKERADENFMDC